MAGRPKRRARLAKMVAAHKRVVTKGKHRCKKCGKSHTLSEHWSHTHGTHIGAHGERAWFGRKTRPQGRRKKLVKARRRKASRYATVFGPIKTTRAKKLHRMTAAEMRRRGRAARKARLAAERARHAHPAFAAAVRKGKKHRVKGHLAKTPGSRHKHHVAGHLAKFPKKHRAKARKGGKKPRSAAQKAATARMLAGLAAKRAGRSRTHLVKGHLAKNPGRRGKHRVAAHFAHDPTDIRGHHRPRLG